MNERTYRIHRAMDSLCELLMKIHNEDVNNLARIQDTSMIVNVSELENIEEQQTQILVYPNPTNESFTISLPEKLKCNSVELYNSMGQLLEVVTPKSQRVQMQINGSPGIYLIHIRGKDGTIAKSIIKQ